MSELRMKPLLYVARGLYIGDSALIALLVAILLGKDRFSAVTWHEYLWYLVPIALVLLALIPSPWLERGEWRMRLYLSLPVLLTALLAATLVAG